MNSCENTRIRISWLKHLLNIRMKRRIISFITDFFRQVYSKWSLIAFVKRTRAHRWMLCNWRGIHCKKICLIFYCEVGDSNTDLALMWTKCINRFELFHQFCSIEIILFSYCDLWPYIITNNCDYGDAWECLKNAWKISQGRRIYNIRFLYGWLMVSARQKLKRRL